MSQLSPRSDRGASELIGVVLLFAFVFTAATFTFYFGMQASDSIQQQNELETAETTMQAVQSQMSSLASSNDDAVTRFDLSSGQGNDVNVRPDGAISFQVNDHPDCTTRMEMGSIVYENEEGTVAYQAGGVWKETEGGSTMVSAPGLSYTKERVNGVPVRSISFPVVSVDGDISGGSETVEARRDSQRSRDAQRNMERSLCLRGSNTSHISENGVPQVENITVKIQNSTYYEAWGHYLSDQFGADRVTVFDGNNTVVAREVPLGRVTSPEEDVSDELHHAALYSTGNAGTETELKFTGVDSFDSDSGPYSNVAADDDGQFVIDGDLKIRNGVVVKGDMIVDGDATVGGGGGSSQIDGNLVHNGTASGMDAIVAGQVTDGANLPAAESVTDRVVSQIDFLASGNNTNGDTPVIQDEAIAGSGEITGGQYYVEDFRLNDSSQTVTLNTTGNELIAIGVEEDFEVTDESTLEVIGDGQVVFYVNDSVTISDGASVTVEGDQTWRNWIYCTEACDVGVSGPNSASTPDTRFTGVVYAPTPADSATGSITVEDSAETYGALVGGELDFSGSNGGKPKFHFDEALLTTNPPEVRLEETGSLDGGDDVAIGGNGSESSPNGTLETRENVTINGTTYSLDSFDVQVELRGSELTGQPNDDLTFSAVEFDLLTDDSRTATNYFPNDEPPSYAAQDNDAAWPSLFYSGAEREPQTARLENLSGGTSFSVAATSYNCGDGDGYYNDDFTDTGVDRTVDGTTYDLWGCTGPASERLSIDASLGANNGNLKILRDGDYLPNVDGALDGQLNYAEMLGEDRVNDSGYLTLEENEVVFLFELSQDDARWNDPGRLNCWELDCEGNYPLNDYGYDWGGYAYDLLFSDSTENLDDGVSRARDSYYDEDYRVSSSDGVYGTSSAEFDGSDYIDLGSGSDTTAERLSDGEFSISLWVNPDADGTVLDVVDEDYSNTNHPLRVVVEDETAYLVNADGSKEAIGTVEDGDWSRITVTYDGSEITGYVNGTEGGTITPTEDFEESDRVYLGTEREYSYGYDYTNRYDGRLDEFKVFGSALSDSQLTAAQNPTEPVAFNDGDPDYNDAVMLYKFTDFQWSCDDNCSNSPEQTESAEGGTSEVDNSVRQDSPEISNDYVIQIQNSQVVVNEAGDDDDDS